MDIKTKKSECLEDKLHYFKVSDVKVMRALYLGNNWMKESELYHLDIVFYSLCVFLGTSVMVDWSYRW